MTINDIAKALGISKASVSRAISGKGRLSQRTRARVLAYIEEHGYRPNAIAQGLASERTYNLGFVVPDARASLEMPFFLDCLTGACLRAARDDYDVLTVLTREAGVQHLRQVLTRGKVDGLILSRNVADDPALAYLRGQALPFVLIGSAPEEDVIQADNDNEGACYAFVRRAAEASPLEAGLLAGDPDHAVSRSRYEGFARAMREMGWSEERIRLRTAWRANGREAAWQAFSELYAQGVRCFFCMDDVIALWLVQRLRAAPLQAQDVRVASFYDSDILRVAAPEVPAIRFDAKALGAKACDLLMRRISGEAVSGRALLGYTFTIDSRTPWDAIKKHLEEDSK